MSENARITRAFGVIGLSTLVSRILGLVREMVIAFYFGAGMAAIATISMLVFIKEEPFRTVDSG